MGGTLQYILDWSEVWALFIPLFAFVYYRPEGEWVKPVVLYLFAAFVINLWIDLVWLHNLLITHENYHYNGFFYNLHSLVRLILFSWFFQLITRPQTMYRILPLVFLVAIPVVYLIKNPKLDLSSPLLTLEAGILLFYCLHYYYFAMREDDAVLPHRQPAFYIVSALCLYTAVNFMIFLFYNYLTREYRDYAIEVWDVHNISYILFCIFIARAFKK